MLTELLLIVSLLFSGIIGLLVYFKNPRSRLNRTLALTILFICVWLTANYFADNSSTKVLFWNRATFLGPAFMVLFLYLFVGEVARKQQKHSVLLYSIATLVGLLALSDYTITQVTPRLNDGVVSGYEVSRGPAYAIVIGWILIMSLTAVVRLFMAYKRSRGYFRAQLSFVFIGIGSAVAYSILMNILIPIVSGSTVTAQYAPLTSIILASALSYAILRHRFLDIRLLVARSVMYALLLISLGGMYALFIFGLTRLLFTQSQITGAQYLVHIAVALILAFSFQPLRRLLEKLTNKIFYQDRYESHVVLDAIGSVIVRTTSLETLVNDSVKILGRALKPEFISVLLYDAKNKNELRQFSAGKKISTDSFTQAAAELKKSKKPITIQDELENTDTPLHTALRSLTISVAARLDTSEDTIGYIVLGQKASGNIYNSQDIDLIKISADELAVAIQNALRYEEITHFNETLQEKIKIATAQLRENNKKLQALDEAKDEFISMASHQLRTPLTSVKGYLSMVLDGDAGALQDRQRKLLEEAFASSQRMVYLISDFLNVSRIQTGKFMLEKQLTNLADVVESEISQLQATTESNGLKINYQKPHNFPMLHLDMYKLRQVIMNFLENAIFYSRPGSVIRVELIHDGRDAVLKIKDQGIGVPAHERHQLFTKFYRASNARKIRPDGTGIGLFMAKKVIVSHGGSVIFESAEGKGSVFGFKIPLVAATLKKSDAAVPTQSKL